MEDSYFRNCFEFKRERTIAGIFDISFDVSATAHVYGLGYSFVEIFEHYIGMDLRLWVLVTPIDGTIVEVTLAGQVREFRKPKRPIVGLKFMPPRLRARMINKIVLSEQKRDVLQDVLRLYS